MEYESRLFLTTKLLCWYVDGGHIYLNEQNKELQPRAKVLVDMHIIQLVELVFSLNATLENYAHAHGKTVGISLGVSKQ